MLFGLFSGTNRLIVKVQVATAEVSTTFSKPSLLRVSCYNFRRNSFQTHVISALVLFFTLFNYCFDFALVFRCHNQRIEKMDLISTRRTLCWIFSKKKTQNKIKYSRSSPDPNFNPNPWCNHQKSYNFFSVFSVFQTLVGNSRKPKSVDSKQKN